MPSSKPNLYGIGRDILGAGLTAGQAMTRARRIGESDAGPAMTAEAAEIFDRLNRGAITTEEANRALDVLEQRSLTQEQTDDQ